MSIPSPQPTANESVVDNDTCPHTHGHVLSLLGQEWRVSRAALSGDNLAELDADQHVITIDCHDEEFSQTLVHELTEYTLEEFGCHFSNYDGDHRYIMTHTQMDNVIKVVMAALDTLTEAS